MNARKASKILNFMDKTWQLLVEDEQVQQEALLVKSTVHMVDARVYLVRWLKENGYEVVFIRGKGWKASEIRNR